MKTKLLIIIGLVLVGIFVGLYTVNVIQNMEDQKLQEEWMKNRSEMMNLLSAQNKCEKIGGTWDSDICLITQKTFDSNKLTCDPGPVMASGTCQSNGIQLVVEPIDDFTKNQNKHPDTPEIFSHGSTKFVNPNHESLKYYKTIQVIDDTYLGKNVQQWQDAWDWELESNYEIYKDEFYEELGRLLVKNEITQVMSQVGIINAHDDFRVHQGYSLLSLPPHVGFTAVINATDGNSYLIEASAHSNRVNYHAITQLTFFDTDKELSLIDMLSYPQTVHVLPEDGHKSRAEPSDLIIHVDNNTVNFVNHTPETIRIQESGTGEIAKEHELTWIGPTIPPFGNGQVIFEKPGIYEWDARKTPTLESPLWWDSHAGGEVVVLSDNVDDLPLEDRLGMGRAILKNSEIPFSGMGIGNAEHALKVSLRSAIYEMLSDAVPYYQDRAEQLIPFDIPIIIEG